MILRTNHGTGDTYMTLAFARAYAAMTHQQVSVAVPDNHKAIADMFPDIKAQPYFLMGDGEGFTFNVHPSEFSGDISQLAYKDFTSHADLWRCILGLPVDAPMQRGLRIEHGQRISKRVFIIPKARSIPNSKPEFWDRLCKRLSDDGWDVRPNEEDRSLSWTFDRCSEAEWVIGPQCGVMSIICHALFPCRKTFVTPSLRGSAYPVKQTFPYCYVTKFAGEDYDVEEFVMDDDDVIEKIATGANSRRLMTGGLSHVVNTPLSIGDFSDRLSILVVKCKRFSGDRLAMIERELNRHILLAQSCSVFEKNLFDELLKVNTEIFILSETIVPNALNGRHLDHDKIIALNKRRVELKNEINKVAGSSFTEVKSYYDK